MTLFSENEELMEKGMKFEKNESGWNNGKWEME